VHRGKVLVLAKREYMTRIQGRGFWIGVMAVPVLMLGIIGIVNMLEERAPSKHHLVVVDGTGQVGSSLEQDLTEGASGRGRNIAFTVDVQPPAGDADAQRAELDRRVLAGEIDAWLWIPAGAVGGDKVEYHAENLSNFSTQGVLERRLTEALGRLRMAAAGLDYDRIQQLTSRVNLSTVRVTSEGGREEGGEGGALLSYLLFMFLYFVIAFQGQQVMIGVLEEKTSRVVEIIISKVTPAELMLGKILGICAVGLTQLSVWVLCLVVLSQPALSSMLPTDLSIPPLPLDVLVHYLILFVLGFFVFAGYYAAIGSAFNSTQEAQQLAVFAILFLIAPIFLFQIAINDPDSTLITGMSFIPVFTPLMMALRIAIKMPPLWQLLLSYVITGGFVVFMVWVCSRIYRIGILMYGKRPTVAEIIRWARVG
jgi:ABC-2 type transport system permease protein